MHKGHAIILLPTPTNDCEGVTSWVDLQKIYDKILDGKPGHLLIMDLKSDGYHFVNCRGKELPGLEYPPQLWQFQPISMARCEARFQHNMEGCTCRQTARNLPLADDTYFMPQDLFETLKLGQTYSPSPPTPYSPSEEEDAQEGSERQEEVASAQVEKKAKW